MKPLRTSALLAGVFFLITEVAAIAGLALYGPVLDNPRYIASATGKDGQVLLGAFFELVLVAAIIGTAVTLFPVVRGFNERVARVYRAARLFEAAVIAVGIVSIVSIVALRQDAGVATGETLLWIHDATFLLGPGFALGLNSTLLAYLMYKSQLVPRTIARLGMVGGSLIAASSFAVLLGLYEQASSGGLVIAMPVFAWEVSLALWMIIKGFKTPPPRARAAPAGWTSRQRERDVMVLEVNDSRTAPFGTLTRYRRACILLAWQPPFSPSRPAACRPPTRLPERSPVVSSTRSPAPRCRTSRWVPARLATACANTRGPASTARSRSRSPRPACTASAISRTPA